MLSKGLDVATKGIKTVIGMAFAVVFHNQFFVSTPLPHFNMYNGLFKEEVLLMCMHSIASLNFADFSTQRMVQIITKTS
jgi:hypothetical protein